MEQPAPASEEPAPSFATAFAQTWLSPRRKRFWAALVLLLYTLGGFFLVPVVVKSMLVSTLRDDFGRAATVDRVRFNPYVLSLEVNGLAIADPDAVELAGFDRFFVNFQLSSLFRWAWTFREVHTEGLRVYIERFAPGDSRLTRLLSDFATRTAEANPEPDDSSGAPRLLVHKLVFNAGVIRFRDNVPADPVELDFGPIEISIDRLNTLPDHNGQQSVSIQLPNGAALSWRGSLDLSPLHSAGTLTVENSQLDRSIAYLTAILPLEAMQATLSLQTDYRVREREDGGIELKLDGLEAVLADVAVAGLEPVTEFIAFPTLHFSGGSLRVPENTLNFSRIQLTRPRIVTWLDEAGELNLRQLAAGTPDGPSAAPPTSEASAWQVGIEEFAIEGGQLAFTDRSISPAGTLDAQGIELTIRAISNDPHSDFPVVFRTGLAGGGDISFEGQIGVLPEVEAAGSMMLSGVPTALAQPYAEQWLQILIAEGLLDTALQFELGADGSVTTAGELAIAGLRVEDTIENEPLLGWTRLEIDRFEAGTVDRRVALSTIELEQPFGRLVIQRDRTTNLSSLFVSGEPTGSDPEPQESDTAPFAFTVGGILVRDGSMDFADLSLPLPFATFIRQLEGRISTVDTTSTEPANIRLEGKVDDYGLARIEGAMNLLDPIHSTDVTMEFRNLLMSNLTPYTVDFAGREIDEGKLDLDLNYRIVAGQMQGRNDIVLRDLVLGAAVENPDAVSLPLDLAVALLTDANGVIDIDLPVEGDVNDPEFKIGGVIWKAFAGLITKIVTAPFRLLGNLIGIDSEDLGQFEFLAGRTDLTPPELEKVAQLRQALQQRPELAIEVPGVFDPDIDSPALRFQKLKAAVVERLGPATADPEGEFRMLNEQVRDILEQLFAERYPEIALDSVKQAHVAPPADDPEGKPVLDELAYAADLRDRLLASTEISQEELDALGSARAEVVREAFLSSGEFEAERIVLPGPSATESEDSEWVVLELGVSAE